MCYSQDIEEKHISSRSRQPEPDQLSTDTGSSSGDSGGGGSGSSGGAEVDADVDAQAGAEGGNDTTSSRLGHLYKRAAAPLSSALSSGDG